MYCQADDLISRFGIDELTELTDRDGALGEVNLPLVTQAIDDASATIDGYIGGRYRLPLPTVPRVLTRIACDLARYFLYDEQLDSEHQVAKRYKDAISYLEQVGKGVVQLGFDDNATKAQTNNSATMLSAGSVFARERSKGFI